MALLVGTSGTAHADDDIDGLSFYRLSSSMTALFSTAQEPESGVRFDGQSQDPDAEPNADVNDGAWRSLLSNPASAGSVLGYADENYNPIAGWINSRMAQSSDSVGYDTLRPSADSGTSALGPRYYAMFGATLNSLGLDSTSTGLSLPIVQPVAGGLVLFLFWSSHIVDALWANIISFLIFLNPFRLFYEGISALNPRFADGMVGGEPPEGALGELAGWFGEWYQILIDITWTVMVPIFVATFALAIMMFQKMDKGGVLKKLVVRLFFIVLGVPLLGSMYTGVLNSLDLASSGGNSGPTRVVLSTFVDFEAWAMQQRLRVPDESLGVYIEWNYDENAPSGRSQASVRDLALVVNAQVLGLPNVDPLGADNDSSWTEKALGADESEFTQTNYAQVSDVMWRYIQNEHISASSFETDVKGELPTGPDSETRSWFDDYIGDPADVVKDGNHSVGVADNPLISVAEDAGLTAGQGGIDRPDHGHHGPGGQDLTDIKILKFTSADGTEDCGVEVVNQSGGPLPCNLSPLAMYNYLNTDFGTSSYTAYSSGKTTSEATRSIHNSVNLVGTGLMSLVYWVHAVVILGAFVIIGFGYAFAMLIGNIRRSFQLITAVPFATLGSISGISKVIVYTIALVMEVVVTIFLYKFVQYFLMSIPSVIEAPIQSALDEEASTDQGILAFLEEGGFITMLVTLVSIIVTVLFVVMAMRLRKTMVKAVEDTSSKLVDDFMKAAVGGGGGGGAGGSKMPGAGPGAKGGANTSMGSSARGGGGANAGGTSGGSSSSSTVSGNVDTDGTLESSSEGEDASGSALGSSDQEREADEQERLGRETEANGLSGDPAATMTDSMEKSNAAHKEANQKRMEAGKEGAEAVGHGVVAAGRGAVGDGAGAVKSAGEAGRHAGEAGTKKSEANRAKKQAGQSTLDGQQGSPKENKKAAQSQQLKNAGAAVSQAGGAASGDVSGGTADAVKGTPKPKGKRKLPPK
ncbi:hypothetical protein [Nocardiopsis sp. NPDC006938]|uniref:hypothetical protein n=1 Tax=Nocardiopsis sp. NPDC006938 TaxID=3364337 RepID=UPI0036A9FF12